MGQKNTASAHPARPAQRSASGRSSAQAKKASGQAKKASRQAKKVSGQVRKTSPNKKEKRLKNGMKAVRKRFHIFSVRSGLDMPFLFLVLLLVVVGLIMLFSASYPFAYYYYGDSYFFIRSQAMWAILGIVAMLAISYFDYHHLHKFAIPILIVSFALLVIVLMLPAYKDVNRWIRIGSLLSFQPSEIMKFAIVLSFAHLISLNFKRMNTFKYGILPYALILIPTVILLVREPHISCTVIVVLLAGGMLFIGGVKLRWFGVAFGVAAAALLYMVLFTNEFTYANDRILGWLDPFTSDPAMVQKTWQTRQSLYSIGSGGLLGLGLGNSRQKFLYLPEPQNDFIFAIVCEELGFIGALIIILLFALLVWRGITISMRAKDKFGALLGIGLTAQVGLQVLLNIAVVTNVIPNTGISLPFFSHGGTSLVMLLAQMGIVLSISRSSSMEKT